jgi:hypothetical protein
MAFTTAHLRLLSSSPRASTSDLSHRPHLLLAAALTSHHVTIVFLPHTKGLPTSHLRAPPPSHYLLLPTIISLLSHYYHTSNELFFSLCLRLLPGWTLAPAPAAQAAPSHHIPRYGESIRVPACRPVCEHACLLHHPGFSYHCLVVLPSWYLCLTGGRKRMSMPTEPLCGPQPVIPGRSDSCR